jgi:hypothetical protein
VNEASPRLLDEHLLTFTLRPSCCVLAAQKGPKYRDTLIKQRYYPMRGFGSVASASRFCRAFDEVRQFFRVPTTMKQQVSLAHQREVFRQRLEALKAVVAMA